MHEAASFAGGRCRSYLDPTLGVVIDNGNHLLLSGNHEALDYLDRIGARQTLHDPGAAIFDFADLKSGERWRLDLNEGRIPWWLFDRKKRVPGHGARRISRPAWRVREGADAQRSARRCAARDRFTSDSGGRFLTSALNTDPPESSAALTAALLRETLAAGRQGVPPALCGPWTRCQLHRSGARFSRCARLSGSVRRPPSGDPVRGETRRRARLRPLAAGRWARTIP